MKRMIEFRAGISQDESISMLPVLTSVALNINPAVLIHVESLSSKELVRIVFGKQKEADLFIDSLSRLGMTPASWSFSEHVVHLS